MGKTLTAPLAVIRVQTPTGLVTVGKMKNIRISEDYSRGKVVGIGAYTASEVPSLVFNGTLSCSAYLIDFKKQDLFSQALNRIVANIDEFIDTILLNEDGIQVDLLRKVAAGPQTAGGVIPSRLEPFMSIPKLFLTRDGMDLSESQIAGRDAEFIYLDPVLYK